MLDGIIIDIYKHMRRENILSFDDIKNLRLVCQVLRNRLDPLILPIFRPYRLELCQTFMNTCKIFPQCSNSPVFAQILATMIVSLTKIQLDLNKDRSTTAFMYNSTFDKEWINDTIFDMKRLYSSTQSFGVTLSYLFMDRLKLPSFLSDKHTESCPKCSCIVITGNRSYKLFLTSAMEEQFHKLLDSIPSTITRLIIKDTIITKKICELIPSHLDRLTLVRCTFENEVIMPKIKQIDIV